MFSYIGIHHTAPGQIPLLCAFVMGLVELLISHWGLGESTVCDLMMRKMPRLSRGSITIRINT